MKGDCDIYERENESSLGLRGPVGWDYIAYNII